MSTQKNARAKRAFIGCALALVLALSACAGPTAPTAPVTADEALANNGDVVAQVRRGLRDHASRITVRFEHGSDLRPHLLRFAGEWMEAAMEETAEPTEGDYIRYQCGGYECSYDCGRSGAVYAYTVTITPKYYMYLVQEEAVTQRLDEIFEGFAFDEATTDYEKILTIYGYLCDHVRYDRVHRTNPHHSLRSTSYAALVYETATCQGYCVALYRMLRQAGIDSRIITGSARGEAEDSLHAWNIVELGGVYYYLDATWDAGKEDYDYFLKGSGDFPGHTPGEEFRSEAFLARYPIAEAAYA